MPKVLVVWYALCSSLIAWPIAHTISPNNVAGEIAAFIPIFAATYIVAAILYVLIMNRLNNK